MVYRYITPLGAFVIRSQYPDTKRVELWIGGRCYGSYLDARMAASDVYRHGTGFDAWDTAANLQAPEDLAGWQKVHEF